jgi:hypothetical protein
MWGLVNFIVGYRRIIEIGIKIRQSQLLNDVLDIFDYQLDCIWLTYWDKKKKMKKRLKQRIHDPLHFLFEKPEIHFKIVSETSLFYVSNSNQTHLYHFPFLS